MGAVGGIQVLDAFSALVLVVEVAVRMVSHGCRLRDFFVGHRCPPSPLSPTNPKVPPLDVSGCQTHGRQGLTRGRGKTPPGQPGNWM